MPGRQERYVGWIVAAICTVLLSNRLAPAAVTRTCVQSGPWDDVNTWEDGNIPGTLDDYALIKGADLTVTISNDVGSVNGIRLESSSRLILTNSAAVFAGDQCILSRSAACIVDHYSGSLTTSNGEGRVQFGWTLGDSGGSRYNLYGGQLTVGEHFQLRGGLTEDIQFNLYKGHALFTALLYVGQSSEIGTEGRFNQYAGTNELSASYGNVMRIGASNGRAEYNLYGGTLKFSAPSGGNAILTIGTNCINLFRMGTATTTAEVVEAAGAARDFPLGGDATATNILQGCGDLALKGTFSNNGRVIADGWGGTSDRTLDLSSFGAVESSLANPGSNGWFAVRRGKLELPDIASVNGTDAYAWGDTVGETDLDLVNSALVTFDNKTSEGAVSIDLLATDRSDVAAAPDAAVFVGVWDVDLGTAAFDAVDLLFRYDDALADPLLAADPDTELWLYRHTGTAWARVGGATVDSGAHRIGAAGLETSDFSAQFAVAVVKVPKGTVFLIR